jgi:heme-degrading monooxygenase HmoA
MAFVRTITYTFPYAQINELQPGTDTWLRLVSAHKLLAQESEGMLDTGVWMTQNPDGDVRVVSVTEWYSLDEMQSFASDPDVRHHETEITKLTAGDPTVEIYEVIG